MRRRFHPIVGLSFAAASGVLASGCGRAAESPAGAAVPASPSARTAGPREDVCSLLTAEEVGVIFGKRVDASPSFRACEYDISPDRARPLEQLRVRLEVSGGAAAEADPGARHPRLGRDVMRTVHPGTSGPPDSLALGDGVSGVGDSASAVDVAAVERESGFSSRGRILEARQGSVHLTVGVTIAPDPGTRELDASLAAVAKTALARLAQAAGTKKPEK